MIRAVLVRHAGRIVAVEIQGHAGPRRPAGFAGRFFFRTAEFGNILCAAVSVLCYHLANGLERVEGLAVTVEDRRGFFRISLQRAADAERAAKWFENFSITLDDLKARHPGGLTVRQEDQHVS